MPHIRATAVAAVAACLLGSLAAAQPHHEDHGRAEGTDDPLRLAGAAVLAAAEACAEGLLAGRTGEAAAAGDEAARHGGRLAAAAGAFRDPDVPDLLGRLAPPADGVGTSMRDLAAAWSAAHNTTRPPLERLVARAEGVDAAERALGHLDTYDALGYDTHPLRALLARLLAGLEALVIALPAGRDGTGEDGTGEDGTGDDGIDDAWTLAPDGARLAVLPGEAYHQERVRVLVAGAPGPGTFTARVFGSTHAGPLRGDGSAAVALRVPWDAEHGPHDVDAAWPGGGARASLVVVTVPTRFVEPTWDGSSLRARLVDAHGAAVHPADVAWTGAEEGSTAPAGGITVPWDGAEPLRVAYAGNRTHAPTQRTFTDAAPADAPPAWGGAKDGPTPPTDGGREADAASASPWSTWLLLALFTLFAVLLAAALLHRRRGRRPVVVPLAEAVGAPAPRPRLRVRLHPLLQVLQRHRLPARHMTLREAEPVWRHLGAPDPQAWRRAHERHVYGGHAPAPVPRELMEWARRWL